MSIILGERMKFECGDVIQVGLVWWYGGAYQLALKLNYNLPDMFWVDGDIDGFDKSVMDVYLYLYTQSMERYYDLDGMEADERMVFEEMLKDLSYHMTNKVVLHIGSYWRLLQGVMYSGGKETSHGDSWILALYFWLYIEHIKEKNPDAADLIDHLMEMRVIFIVVYGDDHIWCCPIFLRKIINLSSWTDFLRKYCRSSLRDGMEYTQFLTEVNQLSGEVVKAGPKFLKRYFIKNEFIEYPNSAPILPFRPKMEQMLKLLASEPQSELDYLISAIGHMWDTMGTNESSYASIKKFYKLMNGDVAPPSYRDVYEREAGNLHRRAKLTKLVRKLGISAEEIFDQAPTRDLLMKMHEINFDRCAFGQYAKPFVEEQF
jgi:hypothetical protein